MGRNKGKGKENAKRRRIRRKEIVDKGCREGDLELRRKLNLDFRGYSLPGYSNPLSTHTHSLAGSVTINAKTTVHCSPDSSMLYTVYSMGRTYWMVT
jgi:hypothetical protein